MAFSQNLIMKGVLFMDKEKLNSKLKEMKKQAGVNAQKTKENLGKVFDKENVKDNLNKAKKGVEKAVDVTMNSSIVKKMNSGQKIAVLGICIFILVVIIALIGRFIFSPEPSFWCVAAAPKLELAFHSGGEVEEVAFSAKQTVPRGVVIAHLANEAYSNNLKSAELELMEANLKSLNMENRLTDQENALAEIRIKAAKSANEAAIAAYELADAYEALYREYLENGMISEAIYNISLNDKAEAEAIMQSSEKDIEKAEQYHETVKKGYTEEEITAAKEENEILNEQVAKAKAALDGTSIIAPFTAYLNSISIKTGDIVEPKLPVCEVIDLSKLWLRGLVNKSLAESIKPGSAVTVEFREIPNETFSGKIISVATSKPAEQKDGEDLYELRIELDKPGGIVMPGMEAVAIVVSN